MTTTEPLSPSAPESATTPSWSDDVVLAEPERPTIRDLLDAVLPVIGVVVVAGPPVVFVLVPWLLLVLMLSGPFALVIAFVVVGLVAVALLVAVAALLAAPVVLVRHLHRRPCESSQTIGVPATRVAPLGSPRVAA
jgi:hypothetical protein